MTAPPVHFRAWTPLSRAYPLCAPGPGDASPFRGTPLRSGVTCPACLALLTKDTSIAKPR